ncbi:EcsC family protein [Dysgonomonas massiliensis]|uniref:EcsC family protein n=1 Tax=Dysgonomonas massiliensis TaxID=2040292 RepID=UPI000C764340|nr:EcsC family protein [Dysgonomonas massiliensis]
MTQQNDNLPDKNIIGKVLDWSYTKAVTGFSGVDSAYELANEYLSQGESLSEQVDSLIKWQVAKSAASGFVTGIGGLITLPVAVPANIASVMYVQIRMICAIAHMGGHDIRSDKVKTFIYLCMVGNGAKELLKNVSVRISEKVLIRTVNSLVNQLSTKLATKIGEKGATSLGKAVPVLGGVVGGSLDAVSTRIIGKVAKKIFIDEKEKMKQVFEILPDAIDIEEVQ